MPQSKSRTPPSAECSGQTHAEPMEPAQREPPEGAEDEPNVGDSEIVKSPSDPKQYRQSLSAVGPSTEKHVSRHGRG
uniref:Uncharacterized protein n=1 Tax=Knipowitschia caucasica TaxID=637954 RepID=A0AAV2JIE4_KNICA